MRPDGENSAQARKELSETVQSVNDSVMRMVEMTPARRGQMDALGGQLRAAGRQEEGTHGAYAPDDGSAAERL